MLSNAKASAIPSSLPERLPWFLASFGDILTHRKDFVEIDDISHYKRCRVKLHAKGIVLRDEVEGALIKTKSQQVCRTNDFLVAEIDAKVGGYGIVPAELDGAIVSSHYFLFGLYTDIIDPNFLAFYLKTPFFTDQINAQGSTNYAAIRPQQILDYTIPLPSLSEQHRIVEKIEHVDTNIKCAQESRRFSAQQMEALLRSTFARLIRGAAREPMKSVAPLVRRPLEVKMGEKYPELGIRSFGKGTFHKPPLDSFTVGTKRLYSIEPGHLVFNNVFAWEGAVAVAQPQDAGRFGSHRFITCVPKEGVVTADFICFYFRTPEGLEKLGAASPGGAGRNRTLGLDKLGKIVVPVPSLEKQRWFGDLLQRVQQLRVLEAEIESGFEALLRSILYKAFRGEL